jgi:hypothetical protein
MRANSFKYVSRVAGAAIFLLFVYGLCPFLAQPPESRRFDSFGNIIADVDDVELGLEGEEKIVDLTIFFRERPHVRRSSGFR